MEDDDITIERDGQEEDGMSEVELEERESRTDTKLAKMRAELETAKRERQEFMDGWQRAKADYVNALKRFEEEKAMLQNFGLAKAVQAMLPAYDALERAKDSVAGLPEGFAGIAKQIESAFASYGIEEVGTVGEPFDPSRHEALGMDPTDDKTKDDTVTAVLEKGYAVRGTVLRPARVRVAQFEG